MHPSKECNRLRNYADCAHTGILPSVTRPSSAFRVRAWVRGYWQASLLLYIWKETLHVEGWSLQLEGHIYMSQWVLPVYAEVLHSSIHSLNLNIPLSTAFHPAQVAATSYPSTFLHRTPTQPHHHTPAQPHHHTPTPPNYYTPAQPHHHTPTHPHHNIPTQPSRHTPTQPYHCTPSKPYHRTPTQPSRNTPTQPSRNSSLSMSPFNANLLQVFGQQSSPASQDNVFEDSLGMLSTVALYHSELSNTSGASTPMQDKLAAMRIASTSGR